MANTPKPDPLATLRGHLEAHARDHRAAMFGLSPTLRALRDGIDELERREGLLSAALLLLLEDLLISRNSGQPLKVNFHPATLQALGGMSDHAGHIARRLMELLR